jgi:hypothetical protein
MAILQQLGLFPAGSPHDQPNCDDNERDQNEQYLPPLSQHDDVAALLNQGQDEGKVHAAILPPARGVSVRLPSANVG